MTAPTAKARALLLQLRPKQWTKNVFLFPALVFSQRFLDPTAVLQSVIAFASFSLLASSGYVLNDWLDREADRAHPTKRHRPIASGAITDAEAKLLMAATLAAGLTLAALLGRSFTISALAYLVSTVSYSLYFKHLVILDVMVLAACYVWRVVGGATAISVDISPWLFLCTAFVALFFGFNKRRAELAKLGAAAGTRKNLAHYSERLLEELQSIVTSNTILSYSLYAVMGNTPWMALTIPFVMYAIFRYIYLVEQRGEGGAPDETLLSDRPILLASAGYAVTAMGVMIAEHNGWIGPVNLLGGGL